MKKIGAYEAKTHLPQLLERVSRGEEIMITRHGVPVATLQRPVSSHKRKPVKETIEQIKQFRSTHNLSGLSIKDMIAEGRA